MWSLDAYEGSPTRLELFLLLCPDNLIFLAIIFSGEKSVTSTLNLGTWYELIPYFFYNFFTFSNYSILVTFVRSWLDMESFSASPGLLLCGGFTGGGIG